MRAGQAQGTARTLLLRAASRPVTAPPHLQQRVLRAELEAAGGEGEGRRGAGGRRGWGVLRERREPLTEEEAEVRRQRQHGGKGRMRAVRMRAGRAATVTAPPTAHARDALPGASGGTSGRAGRDGMKLN